MPTHVRHVFLTGFPGVEDHDDTRGIEDPERWRTLTPEGFFTEIQTKESGGL